MKPQSKSFKALQALWYKKAKDSGFKDIEHSEAMLKPVTLGDTRYMIERGKFLIESKTEYYRLAGMFYHDYKFKSQLDRFLWKHNADGLSSSDIERILKLKKHMSRRTISRRLKKLTLIMIDFYKDKAND